MGLRDAVDVVRATRSGGLVYHAPGHSTSPADLDAFCWSFGDLVRALEKDHDFVVLANTSRARTAAEAIRSANDAEEIYAFLPHPAEQTRPVVKLEVLDDDARPLDAETLRAAKVLTTENGMTVIPLISPDPKAAFQCADLGIPMVRIMVGKVGSLAGISPTEDLAALARTSPIPLIFEGGISTPEHVEHALRLGADAVLMNSAFQRSAQAGILAHNVRKTIDLFFQNSPRRRS